MSILIERVTRDIAESGSIIGFETTGSEAWPVWERYLTVEGRRAYGLGNACGTCRYLFERMEGADTTIAVGELADGLAAGIGRLDGGLVDALARLMPASPYCVLLLRLRPRLVLPGSDDDYFALEQVENEGDVVSFWGLPHHPKVPYYRSGQRDLSFDRGRLDGPVGRLFEFVAPMFPERWLTPARTSDYEALLAAGSLPTAVAISLLDVKGPALRGIDHWCLTHYLLDGHHKMAAAARAGCPLTLVAFLAADRGTATEAEIEAALGAPGLDLTGSPTAAP
jgi:hypothetical protein